MTYMRRRAHGAQMLICALLVSNACSAPTQSTRPAENALSAEDSVAVAIADQAYADGWLAGGAEPVMATLHEDAAGRRRWELAYLTPYVE